MNLLFIHQIHSCLIGTQRLPPVRVPVITDQQFCAGIRFFQRITYCFIRKITNDQQPTGFVLPGIGENRSILSAKHSEFPIHKHGVFLTETYQLLIASEYGIFLFQLFGRIDVPVIRVDFDPWFTVCKILRFLRRSTAWGFLHYPGFWRKGSA